MRQCMLMSCLAVPYERDVSLIFIEIDIYVDIKISRLTYV